MLGYPPPPHSLPKLWYLLTLVLTTCHPQHWNPKPHQLQSRPHHIDRILYHCRYKKIPPLPTGSRWHHHSIAINIVAGFFWSQSQPQALHGIMLSGRLITPLGLTIEYGYWAYTHLGFNHPLRCATNMGLFSNPTCSNLLFAPNYIKCLFSSGALMILSALWSWVSINLKIIVGPPKAKEITKFDLNDEW